MIPLRFYNFCNSKIWSVGQPANPGCCSTSRIFFFQRYMCLGSGNERTQKRSIWSLLRMGGIRLRQSKHIKGPPPSLFLLLPTYARSSTDLGQVESGSFKSRCLICETRHGAITLGQLARSGPPFSRREDMVTHEFPKGSLASTLRSFWFLDGFLGRTTKRTTSNKNNNNNNNNNKSCNFLFFHLFVPGFFHFNHIFAIF